MLVVRMLLKNHQTEILGQNFNMTHNMYAPIILTLLC